MRGVLYLWVFSDNVGRFPWVVFKVKKPVEVMRKGTDLAP